MPVQSSVPVVEQPVPADVPDRREYTAPTDAELDRKLCAAIDAADNAENEFLHRLLALELGAHYYETR